MSKTLILGMKAKVEIEKEREIDASVTLRVLVRKAPSGQRSISYFFDSPMVGDYVIKDSKTLAPLVAIDQLSLQLLGKKCYVLDYKLIRNGYYLKESRLF